ncbi:hypothetical protein KEM52_001040, partial [Ascosphaera acerosa]
MRALRCQSSPDYALYRYGDPDASLRYLDHGTDGGLVYKAITTVMGLFETEPQSCSAVRMLHSDVQQDSDIPFPKGSFALVWPVFLRLCVGQVLDAFSYAVSGRHQEHETGISLFEQSIIFSEAQGTVESMIYKAASKARKVVQHRQALSQAQGHAAGDTVASIASLVTEQITSIAAAQVTGITHETPGPLRLQQAPIAPAELPANPAQSAAIVATTASIAAHLNLTPEVMVLTMIAIGHSLTTNVLCVVGRESKYRLVNTAVWGLASFAYIASGASDPETLMRYPIIVLMGFGPHLVLMLGIAGCLSIYAAAVTLTAFSLPRDALPPAGVSLGERFLIASDRVHGTSALGSLHVSASEDFYTLLVKVGYTVLTAATRVVFFNQGKVVSARDLTWVEEQRLAEFAEQSRLLAPQSERASDDDRAAQAAHGGVPTDHIDLFKVDTVGQERPWTSGYAVEKQVDGAEHTDGLGLAAKARRDRALKLRISRPGGVGFYRLLGRVHQTGQFWRAIATLVVGWICFFMLRAMDAVRWRWKPRWMRRWAGVLQADELRQEEGQGAGPRQASQGRVPGDGDAGDAAAAQHDPSEQPTLYFNDASNQIAVPDNTADYDVEAELRKRAFREERRWTEESEERFERKLYDWWKHGGRWGDADASGDYTPPAGSGAGSTASEWDTTSVVSMSSAASSVAGDVVDWEDEEEEEDGRRTPTQ